MSSGTSTQSSVDIDWDHLEEKWDSELDDIDSRSARIDRYIRVLKRLARHRLALFGAILILLLVLVAILAPILAPYSPAEQDLLSNLESPSVSHPFGTDSYGRDVLSRVIFGTRISIQIAVTAVGVALGIGIILGSVAGYYGGRVDTVVQTAVDLTWSFPAILVGLALAVILGPTLMTILVAIGLVYWGQYARLIRGEVLSLREEEFIKAAQAVGMKDRRIIFRHILPNAIVPAFVVATLQMGGAIGIEASLSFLGLGAQPPTPSWGAMLSEGREYMRGAWWIATFPGLAIVTVILGFNLLGDGLRDALDPKLKY